MDPLTIGMALAQLAPVAMRYFGVGEANVQVAEKVIDIAKTVTGAPTGDVALETLKASPELVIQFQTAIMQNNSDLEKAYLADKQSARNRDIEFIKAGKINHRANAMLMLTFIGIFLCVWLLVHYSVDANSALGGALLLLIGKFVGNWGTAFDFEFGSSRGSRDKDDANLLDKIKGAIK